jgi:hypothetical protein
MESNILENLGELLEEARAEKKRVVRKGKVIVKMTCPKGFKFNKQTNNCERMTAVEKRMRSKSALKGAKVRSKNTFGKEQALKARKKSIKKGTSKGLYTKY